MYATKKNLFGEFVWVVWYWESDEKLKNMSIVKLILRLMILCFSVWDLYLIFKPFLQYAEIGVAANQMEYGITAIGVTLFIMLLSYINVNLDQM